MTAQDLKNSILQWAVQGKLVPQDPADEPASELLKRIRAEKAALIKDGKLKKEKNESHIFRRDNSFYEKIGGKEICIDDEIPFDIPDSWEWVRLGEICFIARGGSPRPINAFITNSPDGVNWIKIGDTQKDGKFINSCKEKITLEGVSKSRLIHQGDFLLTNSMSFGRPYISNITGCIHDGWLVLSNYQSVFYRDFLYYLLSSRYAYEQFSNVVSGAVVQNLNSAKVAFSLFPLPPLAEQKRIVEKIEELMPLVEAYGKAEEHLTELNRAFPEQLKKSVLQWAVQGKLVPQNPADEPASELLKRIRAEKAALIKDGKLKKEKPLPPISEEEIPFHLPTHWETIRIGDAGIYKKGPFGSSLTKQMFVPRGPNTVKVYEQKNAIQKDWTLGEYYITRKYFESKMSGFEVFPGDVIVSCAGTIGETYIVPNGAEQGIINQALMRMKIVKSLDLDFFLLYFDYVLKFSAKKSSKGSAIKNIPPFDVFKQMILSLPPLAEQQRIVERVEELLQICYQINNSPKDA